MRFTNREEAAAQLADRLAAYRGLNPLVLGVPRGAVPMARIIADALGGDLDLVLVRRLRAPGQPEFAIGAVDDAGAVWRGPYFDSVADDYVRDEVRTQQDTLRNSRDLVMGGRPRFNAAGRVAILVDDGIATGSSMQAAIDVIRAQKPHRIVVAVAVAAPESLALVSSEVDEVICLHSPELFQTVAQFFENFPEVDAVAQRRSAHPAGERLTFAQVLAEELNAIEGRVAIATASSLSESDVYDAIHGRGDSPEAAPLAALCLSGGGIRSATFALGVIQGLARCGLLPRFQYLSTVSGGGYIGSWLTAWIHRKANEENVPDPLGRVTQQLAGEALDPVRSPHDMKQRSGVAAEAPAIVQLRAFSNYLAPQVGLLSADIWTLVATILRNVILNWLVLIPALVALLAIPRLMAWATSSGPKSPLWHWSVGLLGFFCCAWSIAYVNKTRAVVTHRPRQSKVLWKAILPTWAAALSLTMLWAWLYGGINVPSSDFQLTSSHQRQALMIFGIAAMSAGWVFYRYLVAINRLDADLLPKGAGLYVEIVAFLAVGMAGGFILWLAARIFDGVPLSGTNLWSLAYPTLAPPAFVLSFTLAATIFTGAASSWMSEEEREWWSRFGAWALISATAWTAVGVVVLLAPQWIASGISLAVAGAATVGSGALTILGGLSKETLFQPRSEANQTARARTGKKDKRWFARAVSIGLPIFVVLFAIFLSLLTDLLVAMYYLDPFTLEKFRNGFLSKWALHVQLAHDWFNLVIVVGAAVIAAAASWFVDINKFSLHAMYRNRLIRAYLGASRGTEVRHPDPFIGFDRDDDFAFCSARPRSGERRGLFHVVNMSLNLVAGDELAWQERKAESMTASSLHVGTRDLGYRRAEEYGGSSNQSGKSGHPLTLGTAMAISGAAASPNMGYHSSPVLTFLMTLFNARLGWWLGNPGEAGDKRPKYSRTSAYARESPVFALYPLFSEAFGLTDRRHPYVYVSDGGHFDNLGLYEMVRRRCHFIMVVDGGADPDCGFEDLSAAIRKVRSDMGVPIDVPVAAKRYIFARSDQADRNRNGKMAFLGRIRYSDVDCDPSATEDVKGRSDGILVYIKPAFYDGSEPLDVVHYAKGHPAFPHETTGDQFFSESQFESYRALGAYAVELMTRTFPAGGSLDDFKTSIDTYVTQTPA